MKIRGNDLFVFIQRSGIYKAYAYSTTCEIDVQAETIGVGSPDTGRWSKKKKKKRSWRLSSAYLVGSGDSAAQLFSMLDSDETIKIMFGTVAPHKELMDADDYVPDGRFAMVGDGLLTRMTVTGRRGDFVTMSVEIEGSGKLDMLWSPVLTVSPLSGEADEKAGVKELAITSNIGYTVSSDSPWLTVDRTEGGEGTAKVMAAYPINEGAKRIGKILVAGKSPHEGTVGQFTLTQSQDPGRLVAAPSSLALSGNGGEQVINISGYKAWHLNGKPDWVKVTPDSGGVSGEYGEVAVTVKAETNLVGLRSGEIGFVTQDGTASAAVAVTQDANVLIIDPSELNVPYGGGTYTVTVKASGDWQCMMNLGWCGLDAVSGSAGETEIELSIDENDGYGRVGILLFELPDAGYTVGLSIIQTAIISLAPSFPLELPYDAYGDDYVVTSEGNGWMCADSENIEITPDSASEKGSTDVHIDVPQNDGEPRIVVLKLFHKNTYLFGGIQQAYDSRKVILTSFVEILNVPKNATLRNTYIASLKGWVYDPGYTTDNSWLTVTPSSGDPGVAWINISLTINNTGEGRIAEIWFRTVDGTDRCRVRLHQLG